LEVKVDLVEIKKSEADILIFILPEMAVHEAIREFHEYVSRLWKNENISIPFMVITKAVKVEAVKFEEWLKYLE
jgi:hypothetical protein